VRTDRIRQVLPCIENNQWFFDTELLLVAEAAGLVVTSVPVRWVEDLDSRVHIASTVIEDLRGLLRVRLSLTHKVGYLQMAGVA